MHGLIDHCCRFFSYKLINGLPAQPQIEQQYRKCGSTISLYRVLSVSCGRNVFESLRKPIALETLVETVFMCSFQLRELSIVTPRYFVFLYHFKLLVANFQLEIFITIFEDFVLLLGRNKHRICFCNI